MRAALHPAGILIAHVLPVLVLAALYADALGVIHPLLDAESIAAWRLFAGATGAAALAAAAYAIALWRRRARVHALYGALIFLAYTPLLWALTRHMDLLFPWSVPRWMMPPNPELYAFRLLSIPLAHALFVLVARSLPEGARGRPVRDLLLAAAIPLCVYLFVEVARPFRHETDFERHAWVVVMIALTIGFLFLALRGAAALVLRVGRGSVLALLARVVVALVLPLCGLAVNNGLVPGVAEGLSGLFGDLSHPAFYGIALLNAAAVIWPSSAHPSVRLAQFALRMAGLPYALFFFVLFVPLLPLSIVAIVAAGAGFLLLAPVLLFAVQATLLWQDARFLRAHRSRRVLAIVGVAAMALIPSAVLVRDLNHRSTLHGALRYVFESDPFAPMAPLDGEALAAVLEQVEANRAANRWRGNGPGGNTPFLTPLYNRIVLDHLTLSEPKADLLGRVVLDAPPPERTAQRTVPRGTDILLDSAWAESRFDPEQQAWRSQVHLTVRNTTGWPGEYATLLDLPDGAWVDGHYLVMGRDTVPGLLAEEKAATWVYNRITSYRQDPSIMRYAGPNRVDLRVFPVDGNGVRHTGFGVLHRESFALELDGRAVQLGDPAQDPPGDAPVESGEPGAVYLPAALKQRLERVQRRPHAHLIVDGAEGQRGKRAEAIARVRRFAQEHGLDAGNATLHITDGYGTSLPYGEEALDAFARHAGHGGFFADRPIRRAIAEALLRPGPEAPVFIVVPSRPPGDADAHGILLDDLPALAALLPEGDGYLALGPGGAVSAHRFGDPGAGRPAGPDALQRPWVRAWPLGSAPLAYVADGPHGSVLADYTHLGGHRAPAPHRWADALALECRQRGLGLRAQETGVRRADLAKGSFAAQVLMPQTAWICLEDEAQRNALRKKQEEVLSGQQSLDAMDETVTNMPEPGLWWLLPALLAALALRRRPAP